MSTKEAKLGRIDALLVIYVAGHNGFSVTSNPLTLTRPSELAQVLLRLAIFRFIWRLGFFQGGLAVFTHQPDVG